MKLELELSPVSVLLADRLRLRSWMVGGSGRLLLLPVLPYWRPGQSPVWLLLEVFMVLNPPTPSAPAPAPVRVRPPRY